uniref:pre-B-cell leukemia transcription factor-interacting protein 1-like isoform X2 n=1 Tax=Pristiophorus japonicus TaxID=55135 RepID=UPI00398F7104
MAAEQEKEAVAPVHKRSKAGANGGGTQLKSPEKKKRKASTQIRTCSAMDDGMSGSPDEAQTSIPNLLVITEDLDAESEWDGTCQPSPITNLPDVKTPPSLAEHEEEPTLQTSREAPPFEAGTGEGASDPPDVDAAGSGDPWRPGAPAEESKGPGAEPEVPSEGGGRAEGSWSIQIENVPESGAGQREASWGERLRARIRASFSAPAVSDIEEIGSLSVQDESGGLRKRQLSEAPGGKAVPRVSVVLADEEEDVGFSLNKCILVALVLVGIGFGIFGSFADLGFEPEGEGHPPELDQLYKRVMDGHPHSDLEIPLSRETWIDPNADNPEGGPSTVISLSALLDKLANENQQIRTMHVELQAQKDELEGLLREGGERLPAESQQNLNDLARQLAEHLVREESTLCALQDELHDLRLKISDGATPSEEAIADDRREESFLAQKENLVAEALMLRRELDKQRSITISMREALASLIVRVGSYGEGVGAPKILEGLEEMESQLAFELGRSETWEKAHGRSKGGKKHAKRAAKQRGEGDPQEPASHSKDEASSSSGPSSNTTAETGASDIPLTATAEAGDQREPPLNATREAGGAESQPLDAPARSTFAQSSDAAKGLFPGAREGPSKDKGHKEWKSRIPGGQREARAGGKEGKKAGGWRNEPWEDKSREGWKSQEPKEGPSGKRDDRDHRHDHQKIGRPNGRKDLEKDHKRQKGTEKHGKKTEENRPDGDGKHRHHEHNKFWKKDQELGFQRHRYGALVGCSDVASCAHKEGLDLFNAALRPVGADWFHALLKDYVQASELGSTWGGELEAMAAPFFKGGVFVHDQMRFSDFLDHLDDYIEEIAEQLFGDDDAVEDFEDFAFKRLFGERAVRNKHARKDRHRSVEHRHKGGEGHRSPRQGPQHGRQDWQSKWRPTEGRAGGKGKRQTEP